MRNMHREIPRCAFRSFQSGPGKGPEVIRNASARHRSVDFPEASLSLAGCSVSFVGLCSNQSLPAADPIPRRRFPSVQSLKKEIEKCRPPAVCTKSPSHRDPSTKSSSGRCGDCRKPAGAPKRGCNELHVRPSSTTHRRNGACRTAPCTGTDRKSTRLNSSHSQISYAVFCLKKKKISQLSTLLSTYTHI